ncbi:hypothetical protein [Roseimicrobium gellanilyticum]|uniref:hypothetical protein n=1 Tax=Roseimicrobium gellanilyticum TaxID=748857 RepID=UPI0011BF8E79|nr:hypothetical protein [Roseimicrobium gellanilyticum]
MRLHSTSAFPLAQDWQALAGAKRDVATLTSLLRILALVPSSEGRGPCWTPRFGEGRDARPWISDREVLRHWLVEMSHHWNKAIAPLVKQRVLPASAEKLSPERDGAFCPDVFALARFGKALDMRDAGWDARFARRLLPFVSGDVLWEDIRKMQAQFLSLPILLQEEGDLCRLVSHGVAGAQWMALLPIEQTGHARLLLDTILQLDGWKHTPKPGTHRLIATVLHISKPLDMAARLRWAVDGLVKGLPWRWLAGTLHLAEKTGHFVQDIAKVECCPSATRLAAFAKMWNMAPLTAGELWKTASLYPGAWEMLRCITRRSWTATVAIKLYLWIASFGEEDAKYMPGRWALLREHWKEILQFARHGCKRNRWENKRSRREIISLLQYGFDAKRAETEPEIGRDAIQWAHALRNAQTIDSALRGDLLFRLLPCFWPEQRQKIATHLTRLLSATKKVERSFDFAYDMRAGAGWIPPIGRRACLFFLLREPRAFVKAFRLLGLLKKEAAKRVADVFAAHPLVTCNAETCSLKELAIMVEAASLGRIHGLDIKERLRAHLANTKPQPPHLVEADRVELLQAWARLALEVLQELVQRELKLMFPIFTHTGASGDTVLFLHTLDENRRKGRSLVRKHLEGLPAPKEHHPANRHWLGTLPSPTSALWIGGFTRKRQFPKLGEVTISVEQDPQEILRMGDYGRSCLGAGACNQYSAITNALEANKQVVYARDSAGRVVGRQLIAISEEKRLVCFMVYPYDISDELEMFFAAYDRDFAQALQIPLETEKKYTMAAPLGLEWYDDGAWKVPDASPSDETSTVGH